MSDTNNPAPIAEPACTWRAPDRTGMRYPEQSDLSGGATDCAPAPAVDERTADSDSGHLAAVPEGYEWALVSGLKPMLAALERAERKGYLPDAMADEWADFDYLPTAPPSTPNASLPPLGEGLRTKIQITVEVPADWANRLDMQWVLEREIHADRWMWNWPTTTPPIAGVATWKPNPITQGS